MAAFLRVKGTEFISNEEKNDFFYSRGMNG